MKGSLQNELIPWIVQLRPESIAQMDRLTFQAECLDQGNRISRRQSRRLQVLRPSKNSLVLQNQGNRNQRSETSLQPEVD